MFSSLDRADIELKPGPDRRQKFVQTDHRTAVEIEETLELSVLFALIRILNPKRLAEAGSPEPIIFYAAQELPPELLRRAIHTAGGRLMINDKEQPAPADSGPSDLQELISSAFTNLAHAVAKDYNAPLTLDGLQKVELALANEAGDREEEEIEYWTAVVKLGSFGGEVIRALNGGQWRSVNSGTLPFVLCTPYRGEEAKINPLGKAIKRFANGEEDSLVYLAKMVLHQPKL
jgi:hypothetical protein